MVLTPQTFLERLDVADNERETRERLASGQYNFRHAAIAKEWLRRKEEGRERESCTKLDAREEERLRIAKEANSIARSQTAAAWRASRYSMYAAVVATMAAIAANKDAIFSLFVSWLP